VFGKAINYFEMFPSNRTRSLLHIFRPTVTLCHIIMPAVLCGIV